MAKSISPQMICPHCQTKGRVWVEDKKMKVGVSGGKATAAVFTAGLSMFATGLSRKQKVKACQCLNCRMEWIV